LQAVNHLQHSNNDSRNTMKKPIQKRIKGNKVLELDPERNATSNKTVEAFKSINSDEPMDLQDFLLMLNDRIKEQHQRND
jgi:hypothetical protein